MRRVILSLVAMRAIAAAAAMPACAQQSQPGQQGQQGQPEVIARAFTAELTGQVDSVDHQSGRMRLQTVDGPVTIRFPPAALPGVNKGDSVTVAFGLVKPAPSASPQTSPGSTSPSSR